MTIQLHRGLTRTTVYANTKAKLTLDLLAVAIITACFPTCAIGAAIEVSTAGDAGTSGSCTFRQAVASINSASIAGTGCIAMGAFGMADTISFNPSVVSVTLADMANNSIAISSSHDLMIQGTGMGGVTIERPSSATNQFGVIRVSNAQCTLSLAGITVSGGYALSTAGGGGIYSGGDVVLASSIISGNTARAPGNGMTHGGGIAAGTVSLSHSVVSGNKELGFGLGGGVFANDVTLTDTNITGNYALGSGGGVEAQSTVTVTDSVVSLNAAFSGGGILSPVISITGSTIRDNTATGYGGGLSGVTTMSYSTVSGNSAMEGGGGINAYTAHITNSTISGNQAITYGGAIFGSTISLLNSTVTNNSITTGQSAGIAVGYLEAVPKLTLVSCIVSQNDASAGKLDIGSRRSVTPTGDHNLIGTTASSIVLTSLTSPASGNPLLGPLANNGGATLTHALTSASPAVHAGANPQNLVTDQRGAGFARATNGVIDIGAFELQDYIFMNGFEPL